MLLGRASQGGRTQVEGASGPTTLPSSLAKGRIRAYPPPPPPPRKPPGLNLSPRALQKPNWRFPKSGTKRSEAGSQGEGTEKAADPPQLQACRSLSGLQGPLANPSRSILSTRCQPLLAADQFSELSKRMRKDCLIDCHHPGLPEKRSPTPALQAALMGRAVACRETWGPALQAA